VELDDGSRHPGFLCEGVAAEHAPDITAYGGWLAYRETRR
jgi:allophanate hydrolase